jgi:hypothetical protein
MRTAVKTRRPARPLPTRSARLYLRLAPRDLAFFKFCLEAHDNLGYFTVLDRFAATGYLVHSPGQAREAAQFLESLRGEMDIAVLPLGAGGATLGIRDRGQGAPAE